MMALKKILLLVISCFAAVFGFAQQIKNNNTIDKYRAVHWGLDEGLSQAETYCMIKDVKGFLWIGTKNGLNRFDGNSFKIYFHDNHKKGTIANDFTIFGMVEDSLHNLWISTGAGVSRYDIRADTFTNISFGNPIVEIVPFQANKDEVYCWEAGNQITTYNIHSLARKKLAEYDDKDLAGNGTSRAYSYVDTNSKSVWMLTGSFGVPGGGLLQISLKDGKRQHYEIDCPRHMPGHSHGAEAMCYDRKRNSLWLNTNDGLMEFTLADKQFHYVDAFAELIKSKDYDRFVGVALDKKGRVWLATVHDGILIYNPSDLSLTKLFPSDSAMQSEVSDFNACLYIDKDDIVWAGSWMQTGFHQIIPYSKVIEHYTADPVKPNALKSNTTFSIVPAGHGKIWIGTQLGGLNVFDSKTGLFSTLSNNDLPGIQLIPFVIPIVFDTVSQEAWLRADNGYFKADITAKKSYPLIFKNENDQVIPAIKNGIAASFNKHDIVINASYNNQQGIFIVNNDNNTARQVLSFPDNTFDVFFTILPGNGVLFLKGQMDSTGNRTYKEVNGKWVTVPTPIDSIRWTDMRYNEKDSTYWVAGERQLFHFGKDFHLIRRYTHENGLPEFIVTGLMPDKNGNIWFHTDRAIYQLNVETGGIYMLSEKDGFEKQNFSNFPLVEKDEAGNIFFTGGTYGNGFNMVHPDKFISAPSSIYIQSIDVNQKPLSLSEGANEVNSLSLRYFQNKISISTGIIDFYSKGKSGIRYKLDKMDTTWQYAPYYYTIRYEGLPAGKYTLLMQASNAANEFTGPIKSLFIQISPAFWNTWWFRIIAAISLIALFYGIIRTRLQAKFRLQLERSEKEREIVDMKQKATELEMQALRAQMNPHFIFNSLNSINRFILQNNKAQASEYLTKFSKLVRLILQNSQASLITLESELESLELYLNLEALRFNYHFDYKISYPNDMDVEVLKVPPLILQPYVENAIWHGLMHKEEKGQLNVDISEENDYLYFRITDNGVGRKQAAAMASKSATKHKSMGLRITAHRIAILQHNEGLESPVAIHDLVNADGTAAGTEVIIKMPLIYD